MNTIRLCPGCGAPLTNDAPGGLCPQCLLKSQVIGEDELAVAATPHAVPVPGGIFGDYRILKLLGHGGMGEVYEAEHATSGRRVALKVMRHTLASEQDRKRFLREGRLAASVNHPNVVYIHGSEEIDSSPAIAMELVHGGTLKDRLKREGPLPITDAVEAALQIISGVEAAHAAGVLHRDIKPANCFVSADGTVKVGDFGLSVSTLARGESLITASGSVMGTPAYASPEQLRGEELDVTSDIYSVGATLYHLLTGKTPFNATDFVKLITEVLDKQPAAPKSLRAEIPAELSKILLRCLAKERSARFQTYAELRDALLPFRAGDTVPAKPALRFLAALVDDLIAFGPSLLFLAYWSFDPLDTFAHERTLRAALVWLPFFFWYVLYYAVNEGVWGAGVGKTLCGLRVVGRDGQAAGLWRAAARVLVYMASFTLPPFILMATKSVEEVRIALQHNETLLTDWLWVPLTALLYFTMRARNGYAALQDLISGTRVIVRPKIQPRPLLAAPVAAAAPTESAGLTALRNLGSYKLAATLWKTADGELVLAFDPTLRRKVWVHFTNGEDAVSGARRDLSRATRLRWINSGEIEGRSWNAYEALEGAPFLVVTQKPQPWNAVRFWLLDLSEEGAAAIQFPETSPALALDRLWITASGRAVLLEFPAPGLSAAGVDGSIQSLDSVSTLQQFLATVARIALEGHGKASAASDSFPALVPMHARGFLSSLARRTFEEARFIVGNLQSLIAKPPEVTRANRAASLAFVPGVALVLGVLLVALLNSERLRWDRAWAASYPGLPSPRIAAEIYADKAESLVAGGGDAEEVKLAGTYLATHFAAVATNEAFWRAQTILTFQPDVREQLREATRKFSGADATTIAQAERDLMRRITKRARAQGFQFLWVGVALASAIVGIAALVDLIGALGFGVLPLLRVFGIRAVNRAGAPASRLRLLARSAVVWMPAGTSIVVITAIARAITNGETSLSVGADLGIALALMLGIESVIAYAVFKPKAGLQDILTGTRLVPV